MKKYAFIFSIVYLVFSCAAGVFEDFIPTSLAIALGGVAPIFGCIVAAIGFAKIDQRLPEGNEVKSLSWLASTCILAMTIIPFITVLILYSPALRVEFIWLILIQTKEIAFMLVGATLLTVLITFISIRTTFAWWVRLARTRGVGQTAA